MNFPKISLFYALLAFFLLPAVARADALTGPISKMEVPNRRWTEAPPQKTDGTQKIMHPIQTGQQVNIRAHTYAVPVSAAAFIEQVRTQIIQKSDYQGADVKAVEQKKVKGKMWDVFAIRRRDEINQEIWARKVGKNIVLMLVYTGAGTYYEKYHKDLMSLIKKSS